MISFAMLSCAMLQNHTSDNQCVTAPDRQVTSAQWHGSNFPQNQTYFFDKMISSKFKETNSELVTQDTCFKKKKIFIMLVFRAHFSYPNPVSVAHNVAKTLHRTSFTFRSLFSLSSGFLISRD